MMPKSQDVAATPLLAPQIELSEIRVDRGATQHEVSKWAVCPLTNKRMVTPVLLSDGFSYEKDAVCERLARQPGISPSTGGALRSAEPLTNHALQAALRAHEDDPTSQWWLGLTCMQRSGDLMTQPVVLSDGHSYDASEVEALLVHDKQLISRRAGGKVFAATERPIPNRALQAMISEVHGIACAGYTRANQTVSPAFHAATMAGAGVAAFIGVFEGIVGGILGGLQGGPVGKYGEGTPSPLLAVLLGGVAPVCMILLGASIGLAWDRHHWKQEVACTRLLRSSSEQVQRPSLQACLI